MKAMILAAGRGERMRPLTDHCPKPLLKAGSHCLIEYHLLRLAAAGFEQVVINHAWLGTQIEQQLGRGERYGIDIVYSPEPSGGLETAGGIVNALSLLGQAPFAVINGDIYSEHPFEPLKFALAESDSAHLVLVDNPEHNLKGDFGFQAGRALAQAPICFTFSGIAVYRPEFFAGLCVEKCPLAPLLRQAMSEQHVSASHHQGHWTDVGTPERLQQLIQRLDEQGRCQ